MAYFVTGATGFIGRHLLERLLLRNETVYCLVRRGSEDRFQEIATRLQGTKGRVVEVRGDLLRPRLGVESARIAEMTGKIEHFFHLAALYDLSADSESLARSNVDGTRHALELAQAVESGCFHHVSSVAVAGHYEGTFTESMLEQAELFNDPYGSTKHDAEVLVRTEYPRPYRIYRPSVVVGHSETGEIDKADGLYYTFRLIERLREAVPEWLPRIGIEAGSLNIVPVDFVAKALDHIAHVKDLDGRTFHLVDPHQRKASEIIDEICRAARAPTFSTYLKVPAVPKPVARLLDASERLPGVRRISDALLAEVGIPRKLLSYVGHSTEYACDETLRALAGSGIEVPALQSYAGRLWDFWARHFSSTPTHSPRLARAVENKRVLIANAGGRIERITALRLATSGAHLILVDRSAAALDDLRPQILRAGGSAFTYTADLASAQSTAALVTKILERHEGADIVICGAAEAPARAGGCFDESAAAAFEAQMRLQYFGALGLIRGLLPGMRERRSGQIAVLSAIALDSRSDPAYVASSAALDAFAAAAAAELAATGVAVTSVHVPPIAAEKSESNGAAASALGAVSADQAAALICDALIQRPRRANTWLGAASEITRAAAPETFEVAASLLSRLPAMPAMRWPVNPWPVAPWRQGSERQGSWAAIRGLRKTRGD